MNKTKDVIRDFVSRSGHNDTTVEESIKPAVVHETVKRTQQQEINTAVDKEIHQDHYHRTVQPVQDREVLPEVHQHNRLDTEHREFDHRNQTKVKDALAAEAAKFKNERVVEPVVHTQATAPTVQGEHVHHHIHETVQPVIHKETIQPTVVHTTVPIHETHHKEVKHHSTTALPPITMSEFKKKGGMVVGSGSSATAQEQHHFYTYDGEPSADGKITGAPTRTSHQMQRRGSASSVSSASSVENKSHYSVGGTSNDSRMNKSTSTTASSVPRANRDIEAASSSGGKYRDAAGNPVNTKHKKKGGLLDKLNPLTDSNGDGKAGFMK